jgi:hypothetical protein
MSLRVKRGDYFESRPVDLGSCREADRRVKGEDAESTDGVPSDRLRLRRKP